MRAETVPSPAQSRALEHVSRRAELARQSARASIDSILQRHGLARLDEPALRRHLLETTRVTLNFHPDRPLANGDLVIEGLLRDGFYRSQFLTGTSNGSRTAFPRGDRDLWEEALFGGAYHAPGTHLEERPKYGGLNLMSHADGACPRFGSCYFELRPHVASSCSFTWGDSHAGPQVVGTLDAFEPILAVLLESTESTNEALGAAAFDISSLWDFLLAPVRAARPMGTSLDAYVEAQIHRDIHLESDVEALVADPAFAATRTGELMERLCARYGIALRLHEGSILDPSEVPSDFRGPAMGPLAHHLDERFARTHGVLDAVVLGSAAQSLQVHPEVWREWGAPAETFQLIKQLWHVLVRFGQGHPKKLRE